MNKDIERIKGQCHCGTVRFEVRLTDGLHSARRCNCSYCRMRGAVVVSAQLSDLTITAGEQALTLYQFNTGAAKHFFLLGLRHLHPPSTPLKPRSIRDQRRVPGRDQPVRFRGSAGQ